MRKFTALPVSGDAFLLQRSEVNILVDSGKSGRTLSTLFGRHAPEVNRIDIAVCTHADEDHAGGFTTFLDHTSVTIGEYWLPGVWAATVPDLLVEAEKLADALIHELDAFIEGSGYSDSVKAIDAYISELEGQYSGHREMLDVQEEAVRPAREEGAGEPEWMSELRSRADEILKAEAESESALVYARRHVLYRLSTGMVGPIVAMYWLSLIDAADRIRQIALSAIKHHVPIRWFDYEEFDRTGRARGGNPNQLLPVNAVEQTPRIFSTGMAAYCLLFRLSLENRRCLVFFSPGESFFDVLFCGDSPLGHGRGYATPFPAPKKRLGPGRVQMLITAPHHGSESNQIAYSHIQRHWSAMSNARWVRSGGTSKHPGATYRGLPLGKRFCTHCPHLPLAQEAVVLAGGWPWVCRVKGHRCRCV